MAIYCREQQSSSTNSTNNVSNNSSNVVQSIGSVQVDMGGDWSYKNDEGKKISDYDAYFKQAGRELNIDWRLIAAHAYKESSHRVNPPANPKSSAKGMYQITDPTWKTTGIDHVPSNINLSTQAYIIIMKQNMERNKKCKTYNDQIAMAMQQYHDGTGTVGTVWKERTPGKYGTSKDALDYIPKILKKYREYCT